MSFDDPGGVSELRGLAGRRVTKLPGVAGIPVAELQGLAGCRVAKLPAIAGILPFSRQRSYNR